MGAFPNPNILGGELPNIPPFTRKMGLVKDQDELPTWSSLSEILPVYTPATDPHPLPRFCRISRMNHKLGWFFP